jgi:hypothetical protein
MKRITRYKDKLSEPLIDVEEARRELRKLVIINEEEPPQETACGEEANDYSVSYDIKR